MSILLTTLFVYALGLLLTAVGSRLAGRCTTWCCALLGLPMWVVGGTVAPFCLALPQLMLAFLAAGMSVTALAVGTALAGAVANLGLALAVGLALAGGLVEWPFTLVRVVAFYPFYAFGVLFRPQLDALAAAAAEKCSLRRAALAALLVGYGAYFLRVLLADPILDNSPQLFHDVSYAGGDTAGYRVVFYLAGILTTAALAVVFSSRHQLEGLGRHTLAIYLLHMPILAALIEFKFYDLMRGKPLAVVVLWFTLLACATLALLNWQPVQTAFDKLANCWYKRK